MAATWTLTGPRSVVAICTTGTEAPPADANTTDGVNLDAATGLQVTLFADVGQTITVGGAVRLLHRDPLVGAWARFADLPDLVNAITGVRAVTFSGPSAGIGIPAITARGQLTVLPIGVSVSAGNVNVAITVEGERGADI